MKTTIDIELDSVVELLTKLRDADNLSMNLSALNSEC